MALGIHLRGVMALVGTDDGFETWDEGIDWDAPGAGGDASSFSSRRLEAVDWDGDGDLDIVALGEGPKGLKPRSAGKKNAGALINTSRGFVLYQNAGEGKWEAHRLDTGDDFGDHFALGDFNRDGQTDIVVASRRGRAKEVLLIADADGRLQSMIVDNVRPGAFLSSVTAADFDGDGWLRLRSWLPGNSRSCLEERNRYLFQRAVGSLGAGDLGRS